MIRTWSAVAWHGQIVCVVEDREGDVTLTPTPDCRMWSAMSLEDHEDSHIAVCRPGSPCQDCHETAREWWVECGEEFGWPTDAPPDPAQMQLFGVSHE